MNSKSWHRFRVWSVAAVLLLLAVFGRPVNLLAHASLLHSQPSPGTILENPPANIELVFNERIESVFHSLQVVNAQGEEVPTGDATVTDGGESLRVAMPAMPAGKYAVYWRINSLDGHQVQGQFGFGVGAAAPTELEVAAWKPVARSSVPEWFFPLLKGLDLLALSIWLGGLGLAALAGGGGNLGEQASSLQQRWLRLIGLGSRAAGAAFLALEIVGLAGKTAAFMGSSLAAALSVKFLQATLVGSSYGHWWVIRFAAGMALFIAGLLRSADGRSSTAARLAQWISGGVLLASIAATGHAQAAANQLFLAELMHGVHLAAALLWAGGLFHLGIGVGMALADGEQAAAVDWLSWLGPRFSRLAQVCVALMILTGIYNTWLHVPSWAAFLSTGYGRALLGKLFWVAVAMCVAFLNWRKVLPELVRLRQGAQEHMKWVARFQPLLQAEFAGAVIIFATVAMLTNMAPASADPQAGVRELRRKSGAYEVALKVEPGQLGQNKLSVELLDGAGTPVKDARKVMVYLRSLDMDMGLTTGEAHPMAAGGYAADMAFSMSGRWSVSVEVTPARGDAFMVEFELTI